jgi:hypothetical protein
VALVEYRAYTLGKTGHILARKDFEAEDDPAALEHAGQYVVDNDVEVWQLDRLVGLLKHTGRYA